MGLCVMRVLLSGSPLLTRVAIRPAPLVRLGVSASHPVEVTHADEPCARAASCYARQEPADPSAFRLRGSSTEASLPTSCEKHSEVLADLDALEHVDRQGSRSQFRSERFTRLLEMKIALDTGGFPTADLIYL